MHTAVLYFATDDDRERARLLVAGRPLAFRVLMAAARAGATTVAVPSALREIIEPAVARTPSARARVTWIEPGTPSPECDVVFLPVGTLVTAADVRPLLAMRPCAVLADPRAAYAPTAVVSAAIARRVWERITREAVAGDLIAGELKDEAVTIAPASGLRPVATPSDARAAEQDLLAALGSAIDTWLDTVFHRRLSRPVSLLAVRAGISPNTVTLASLVTGLAATACVWQATAPAAVAGLVLYAAAVVLDHADGEVARLTFAESSAGEWLDVAVDTVVHALLVVAMGRASAHIAGAGAWIGMVAAGGIVASAWLAKTSPPAAGQMGGMLNALGNRDGFYAMLVCFILAVALLPAALPALMVVVAAGAHAYWLGRVVYRVRAG